MSWRGRVFLDVPIDSGVEPRHMISEVSISLTRIESGPKLELSFSLVVQSVSNFSARSLAAAVFKLFTRRTLSSPMLFFRASTFPINWSITSLRRFDFFIVRFMVDDVSSWDRPDSIELTKGVRNLKGGMRLPKNDGELFRAAKSLFSFRTACKFWLTIVMTVVTGLRRKFATETYLNSRTEIIDHKKPSL